MDPWRWCCSIAALMDRSVAPSESELSVVAPLPSITTLWLTSSWIENILEKLIIWWIKTKVTMLDHTKTLKLVGKNGRQPRPNGLVVSAGKWAGPIPAKNCANAQKMPSGPGYLLIRSRRIFCTKCNFLLPLRQHIFRQPSECCLVSIRRKGKW